MRIKYFSYIFLFFTFCVSNYASIADTICYEDSSEKGYVCYEKEYSHAKELLFQPLLKKEDVANEKSRKSISQDELEKYIIELSQDLKKKTEK